MAHETDTLSNLATVVVLVAMFCAFFGLGFLAGRETVRPGAAAAPAVTAESPAVYSERI